MARRRTESLGTPIKIIRFSDSASRLTPVSPNPGASSDIPRRAGVLVRDQVCRHFTAIRFSLRGPPDELTLAENGRSDQQPLASQATTDQPSANCSMETKVT